MFELGKTVVSEEILENHFVCDLSACKGACCVDGSAGAPLEEEETQILNEIIEDIKPFLHEEGIKVIEEKGTFVKGDDGDWETPLVDKRQCAYVAFGVDGIAQCGIEKAHNAGVIEWKKPISCHLYPVRIREYTKLTAVNYHKWQVCDPACALGDQLKIPIYQFVREALIRKFGQKWYAELEETARTLSNSGDM
ncbi:MAG: DUF3109 family protein [Flavobacteriaceae bacterium]